MEFRVATFITCVGHDALQMYNGLPFDAPEDRQNMNKILELMENLFISETNIIYINKRNQGTNKSFGTYVTEFRNMATTCKFGTLHDELLRDRIVCGINNNKLRDRLLNDSKLTLTSCVSQCIASETTASHMREISGKEDHSTVHAFRHKTEKSLRLTTNVTRHKQLLERRN